MKTKSTTYAAAFLALFLVGLANAKTPPFPVKLFCVPEVSTGLVSEKGGPWEKKTFSIKDGDRFSIVFDALKNHTKKNQEICRTAIAAKGQDLARYEGGVVFFCGVQTYVENVNSQFAELCSLRQFGNDKVVLNCPDMAIDLKNGTYIQNDSVGVTFTFGYASVTKGTCTAIP
jgi:hypothetical protein